MLWAAALGAVTLLACGDSIRVEDLNKETLAAECELRVSCGEWSSRDACEAAFRGVGTGKEIVDAVHSGATRYDGEQAAACVDALRARGCERTTHDWLYRPEACKAMLVGTRAIGEGCYFDDECASGDCTPPTDGCELACCPGTCAAALAPVAVGQACGPAPCVEGSYCVAGVCGARPPASRRPWPAIRARMA
jgi:hypothetical protein